MVLWFATLLLICGFQTFGADTLTWRTNDNRVSADIKSAPLIRVLEGVSQLTGWHVFVESNANFNVSVKFQELPSGQALRSLLGNLNFALVPQTNAASRLYVFQSSQKNATLLLQPNALNSSSASNHIEGELSLTLKPGAKIESLACIGAGKVTGKMQSKSSDRLQMNSYLVKFATEAAAQAARMCLAGNPDVESIDSNFTMDRPQPAQSLDSNIAQDFNLKSKNSDGDCSVIVGVIDTGVNTSALNSSIKDFFLPSISAVDSGTGSTAGSEITHGPAMAETILQAIQKTTSGGTSAKILSVDVYGNNPTTTTFDVAQGIFRAVNANANVINLSLGSSGDSSVLHNLIKQASDQGVVFFSAAGNQPVTTPTYPAAYSEVIAVTASDRSGQVANYANYGSFVDIMTPGQSVVPFNGQSWVVNGTSTATAYASGIAAGLADSSKNCPTAVISTMKAKLGVDFSGK